MSDSISVGSHRPPSCQSQPFLKQDAVLSSCQTYRYALRRVWDPSLPTVFFIGLNPSTADAQTEDPTLRVCLGYARRWGFGSLLLGNLFAYRSTDPAVLKQVADPVGPDNDRWLSTLEAEATLTLCAWGNQKHSPLGRDRQVLAQLKDPYCLVQLKTGDPGHPLYKPAHLDPVRLLGR